LSDIFHEVQEEVRREKLQKLWKQYGDYFIAAAAALIIAVAGWQLWMRYQENQKAEASAAYMAAHQAASKNDLKGALAKFDAVAKDSPEGYVQLAELSKANTLAADGKTAEAVAAYKAFADKYKTPLGDAARMRAGFLIADTASVGDLSALLKPVSDKPDGFGPQAREILAYANYRTGNMKEAQRIYELLAQDAKSPQGMRQRAQVMATFIKSGGATNFGSVPPVLEQKADPAAPATGTAAP
jgi:hypothetical protein